MNLIRDAEGEDPQKQPERSGIAGRVEAAAKMKAPAPRGKGIAMMVLGVLVMGGLVYDWTTRGGASKRVREITEQQGEPVTAKEGPPKAFKLQVDTGAPEPLAMSPSDALAYFGPLSAEDKVEVRPRLLGAIAAAEDLRGTRASEAFSLASSLVEGSGDEAQGALADLALRGLPLLADDDAAPAVAFFLGLVAERSGLMVTRALDRVILDAKRPVHVRAAAARARPKDGRPEAIDTLAADPATPPELRQALK